MYALSLVYIARGADLYILFIAHSHSSYIIEHTQKKLYTLAAAKRSCAVSLHAQFK